MFFNRVGCKVYHLAQDTILSYKLKQELCKTFEMIEKTNNLEIDPNPVVPNLSEVYGWQNK